MSVEKYRDSLKESRQFLELFYWQGNKTGISILAVGLWYTND